MEAVAANF